MKSNHNHINLLESCQILIPYGNRSESSQQTASENAAADTRPTPPQSTSGPTSILLDLFARILPANLYLLVSKLQVF